MCMHASVDYLCTCHFMFVWANFSLNHHCVNILAGSHTHKRLFEGSDLVLGLWLDYILSEGWGYTFHFSFL